METNLNNHEEPLGPINRDELVEQLNEVNAELWDIRDREYQLRMLRASIMNQLVEFRET